MHGALCCVALDLWLHDIYEAQDFKASTVAEHLGTNIFVPAEGLPHPVSGAGARKPQSGAGHQKQTAPPTGEEADGDRQTGET